MEKGLTLFHIRMAASRVGRAVGGSEGMRSEARHAERVCPAVARGAYNEGKPKGEVSMQMHRILLLNGPNMNMLGVREPGVYGSGTLADLERTVVDYAAARGVAVRARQSNSEAELVDAIQESPGFFDGIVYNPGAHTHYSYALRDAVAAVNVPVVEVHISNVNEREAFRSVSVIAPVCIAQVKGLGVEGYCRAVDILLDAPELVRLGEGYEQRYPVVQPVIVAGRPDGVEPDGATAGAFAPAAIGATTAAAAASASVAAAAAATAKPVPVAGAADAEDAVPGTEPAPAAAPEPAPADAAPVPAAAPEQAPGEAAQSARERVARVRGLLARLGVDALLVRDTPNIQWLTAIDGVFDEERAHALLVRAGHAAPVLHTDSRYAHAICAAVEDMGGDLVVNDERATHVAFALAQLAGSGEDAVFEGRLGIEDSISYAEFAKMAQAFGTAHLGATTDVVLGLRGVKSPAELVRLRAAQAISDAAFQHIVGFMRPGMTEREVQLELEDYMVRHGAEGLAFRSIVATGPNGSDPHAVPGATRLQAGQCVVMDFGAKAWGYCSDITRVVFLGQPDEQKARAWEVLRRANEQVQDFLRPGVTGKEAHELAERVLAEGGFEGKMGHGLGHGVGLEVHELPVLNVRNDRPLVEGNVVTVEPGIYLPGEFGMRLEDCGVVTSEGYEAFSQLGHELVII